MIARISSGSNFYGAAKYNQQKVDSGEGKVLDYDGLLNTQPKTIDHTLSSYNNSRTKKPVFHASLSFSPKDKPNLNEQKMIDISKDYMEKMGYGKQPYIIYRHDDTAHPHVHILTTRVDIEKGKRIERYKEGIKSKTITEELEKKYGLTIAETQQQKLQSEMVKDVSRVLRNEKPETVKALNKYLTEMDSAIRTKNYKGGVIYYKVDGNDKRQTRSSKSSNFKGTPIAYDNLTRQFEANKSQRLAAKKIIQDTLPKEGQGRMPLSEFTKALQAKGVNPIYFKGDKGIYGASFNYKDHTYKGSEIDRSLSFRKIQNQIEIQMPKIRQQDYGIGR